MRSQDGITPNRNVMLYKDDIPNIEVGVEVGEPISDLGRVVSSSLPAGRAATTTHHGRYDDLGSAHRAIIEWCDRNGRKRRGKRGGGILLRPGDDLVGIDGIADH